MARCGKQCKGRLSKQNMRYASSKVTKIIRRAKFKISAIYSDYSIICKYIYIYTL